MPHGKGDDFFDELLSMTSQVKRDLYKDLGSMQRANHAQLETAKHQLDAAMESARQGNYREALRFFLSLQKTLHESNLFRKELAETYVAQAICYAKLGDNKEMRAAWNKACNIEPDDEKLKAIAVRLGLIKQS